MHVISLDSAGFLPRYFVNVSTFTSNVPMCLLSHQLVLELQKRAALSGFYVVAGIQT